jgi:ribosomal protein L11 methyltransferase
MALMLVVSVPATDAELASDALWALGVVAVEERPVGDGEIVELHTSLGEEHDVVTRAAEGFPARWRWHLHEVDDAVADTWRQHAVPTWVANDLVIVPAWVPFVAEPDVIAVRIEPGATFGLGDHPTTVLTARAMREALWPGATVLDVGCGSGVLAVIAALLGAATCDAVDVSPAAVPVTHANAEANGVGAQVHASTQTLDRLDGPYDVVVANILAPALIELAPELVRLVAPSGVLVVSGLLDGHADHVVAALAPLHVASTMTRDGWVAITLRH